MNRQTLSLAAFGLLPFVVVVPACGGASSTGSEPATVAASRDCTDCIPTSGATTFAASGEQFAAVADRRAPAPQRARPDLNGDGLADVVVGTYPFGAVQIFAGAHGGMNAAPDAVITPPVGASSMFGSRVETAGDLDGDGLGDLAVGAPGTDQVYLYAGAREGLVGATPRALAALAGARGVSFGMAIAAGDFDADGRSDLAVGAPDLDARGTPRVHLYLSSLGGTTGAPALTLNGAAGGAFGRRLAADDLDGDGIDELLVGSGRGDVVAVFAGRRGGPRSQPSQRLSGPSGSRFGQSLAAAGDLDGDGYRDVIVGAPGASRAYVYRGSRRGLIGTPSHTLAAPEGVVGLGHDCAAAGDVDRDGYADLIVTAYGSNMVYVYSGSPAGVRPEPASVLRGPSGSRFGQLARGVGDVDGDGFADAVLSRPEPDALGVHRGSSDGLGETPATLWTGAPGFGLSAAGVGT